MSQIVLGSSLKEFFKLLVGEAVSRQKVSLAEVTEFYLVNLLSDFAAAERLFVDHEGRRDTEPLAVIYHRALQQERDEKIRTLRRLGDVSLYTAGFFSEALRDRVVGPDYYIQMGGNAYAQVAELSKASSFASVYWELHQKFKALVEVLEEIAARGLANQGPTGQMKLLESFSRGNEQAGGVLADLGMIPKGPVN